MGRFFSLDDTPEHKEEFKKRYGIPSDVTKENCHLGEWHEKRPFEVQSEEAEEEGFESLVCEEDFEVFYRPDVNEDAEITSALVVVAVPHWNLPLVLDGAPLTSDSSIQDFDNRRANYATNSVEQALLLPWDMVELGNLKKHDMLLSLKRDLALVFYPLAIRVKVATPTKGSAAPLIPLASAEPSDPTPNDKAPAVPLTFSENESPAPEKMGSSMSHPSTKGKVSQEAEKDKGKSC
nr:hypothetical protein CFP56_33141 [Quercus suber]